MCSEVEALTWWLEGLDTMLQDGCSLVVFNCYLTLPVLLLAVKRANLEARFYGAIKSVIPFSSLGVGLQKERILFFVVVSFNTCMQLIDVIKLNQMVLKKQPAFR